MTELCIYDRPWEITENIVRQKLKARNSPATDEDVKREMRNIVAQSLIDPIAIYEISCGSSDGTDPKYIERIKNEANKWYIENKKPEIFNDNIKKTLDLYLLTLVANKTPANKTFSVFIDRVNAPSEFTYNPSISNSVTINMYDLLYKFYYDYYYTKNTKTFSMYGQHQNIKKYINNSLKTLDDCKMFEGNTYNFYNVQPPEKQSKQLNDVEKLLEKNFLTKKSILYVGKYLVYKLLHLCFDRGLDIFYFEHDHSPYHLNCILTKHFVNELKNYKTNIYFGIMSYDYYINKMIKMFNEHGNYVYTGILEQYDKILQNLLTYSVIYFRQLPNTNIYIFNAMTKSNSILIDGPVDPNLEKYQKLAKFLISEIRSSEEIKKLMQQPKEFEYNWSETTDQNYERFKKTMSTNTIFNNYVNNYVNKVQTENKHLLNTPNQTIHVAYGAPGVGKTTYMKTISKNYAVISRDDATFQKEFFDELDNFKLIIKNKIATLGENYDPNLIKLIEDKILFTNRQVIWAKYWQFAILAFNLAFEWAVKNKIPIVTDIGGTSDDPFIPIIKAAKDYKIEVYAFHAKFTEHYANQLVRSLKEGRLNTRDMLRENTEKVFQNLLNLLTDKSRQKIDIYIIDNTYYKYKMLYSRVGCKTESHCDNIDDYIDKDEVAFKNVKEYICKVIGCCDNNYQIVLILVVVLIIILIFHEYIFNNFQFFRKIV
jgi:hypothetical protein